MRKNIMWDSMSMREYVESNGCKWLGSEYKNMKTKEKFIMKCGHKWETSFWYFKKSKNKVCKPCMHKINIHYTYDIDKIKQIVDGTSAKLLSSEYIGIFEPLRFLCSCGNEYTTNWSEFNNAKQHQCPSCGHKKASKNTMLKLKDLVQTTKEIGQSTLLSTEYDGVWSPMTFQCNCGRKFQRKWVDFFHGKCYSCPTCSSKPSKIESKVCEALDSLDIYFNREQSFVGCEYKMPLRFDFYLPNHNMCIEADGIHHYETKPMFGEDMHSTILARDKVKDDYCESHSIKLLRIPYWEFDSTYRVEQLIQEKLNE